MIQNNITPIVVVLAAVLVAAVVIVVYLFWRVRRLEGECELLMRDSRGLNFVEIVNDNIAQVERLLQEVEELSERYAWVLRRMAGAVQHVGVVRFDAFRDLGGLLSFAVAMLDDRGNGLIVSSIYGRTESRTYAKPIVERGSKYELTPEEREAIRLAMQSKEKGSLPVEALDREHEERMANLKLFHEKELTETGKRRLDRESVIEAAQAGRGPVEGVMRQPEAVPENAPEPETRRSASSAGSKTERKAGPAPAVPRKKSPGRVSHVGAKRRVERPARKRPVTGEEEGKPGAVEGSREEPVMPRRGSAALERRSSNEREGAVSPEEKGADPGTGSPRGLDRPVDRLRGRPWTRDKELKGD